MKREPGSICTLVPHFRNPMSGTDTGFDASRIEEMEKGVASFVDVLQSISVVTEERLKKEQVDSTVRPCARCSISGN